MAYHNYQILDLNKIDVDHLVNIWNKIWFLNQNINQKYTFSLHSPLVLKYILIAMLA